MKHILYKVKILTAKHNFALRVIIFSECAKQAITNGEMVGALEYNSADSRVECDNGYVGDAAITCTTFATWQLPLPECTPQGKYICPLITVIPLAKTVCYLTTTFKYLNALHKVSTAVS